MKPIRLSDHARAQLRFRGGFAWEVNEAMKVYVYYLLEERR